MSRPRCARSWPLLPRTVVAALAVAALKAAGSLAPSAATAAAADLAGSPVRAVTLGSAPAVVGLVSAAGGVFCTGSLIAPRVVLTAAHCLVQEGVLRWPHAIYAGADVRLGGVYLRVQGGAVHPAYDGFLHTADLALLRLADGDDRLPHLEPANLAPAVSASLRMVGFGASIDGPPGRQHSHAAAVTSVVRDFFRFTPGSCHGDSGGPLLSTASGKPTIAGVVSMSDASCTTGRAVALASYASWVKATAGGLDPPGCRGGDGRCGADCPFGDSDCPCRADGVCRPCAGLDPDCEDDCVNDGECQTGCLTPDPDCRAGASGAECSGDAECQSGLCAAGRCRRPCADDGGAACHPWQQCARRDADAGAGGVCLDLPGARRGEGCSAAGTDTTRSALSLPATLLFAGAALLRRGARRKTVSRPKR
jgi:V8-like Glu-specific endopeptidase